jgi:hypothetical protein
MQIELLRTRGEVAAIASKVAKLSAASPLHVDATHTAEYFLASLAPRARPRVVACYDHGDLVGVLYTSESPFCGLRTGLAVGGDRMGRGLLLASPDREREVFAAATAFLLQHGLHGMRLHWTPQRPIAQGDLKLPHPRARVQHKLDVHPEGDWLRLQPTYDCFLANLGPHTRRNLRYYRRKVLASGHSYTGLLRPEDIPGALESLNLIADYPMDQARLDRDRRFFAAFGTPVVAGLRDEAGKFISLVTGFTSGTHLHILTQLNGESEALRKLSLSLVLRGYLIEDFIGRGFTAVHFIEGSSPMLGRFCEPVNLQIVSIDDRLAWAAPLKKVCSSIAGVFRRNGMRVPYRLQRAAGSYWY